MHAVLETSKAEESGDLESCTILSYCCESVPLDQSQTSDTLVRLSYFHVSCISH